MVTARRRAHRRSAPAFARRALLALPPTLLGASALAGCGGKQAEDLRSEVEVASPPGPETAHGALAPFTARMLALSGEGDPNTVCSPASALLCLAMVAQGARGETRAQMEEVLGASVSDLADLAGTLRVALAAVGDEERETKEEDAPDPAVAQLVNAAWIQEGLDVEQDYLDALARGFDAGMHSADFTEDRPRERSRTAMNDMVEETTDGLIEELVPSTSLSALTRFVLINALHLKGAWPKPLEEAGPSTFTTADGSSVEADMLTASARGWYEDDHAQAARLDTYGADLTLVLVRPRDGVPAVLEQWAADEGAALAALLDGVEDGAAGPVSLTFPPFDLEAAGSLTELLGTLGMSDVFDPHRADLSGITTAQKLFVSEVIQKTVITVDEKGMEAAAATAALMEASAAQPPPRTLRLDVPFLFLAVERGTRTPLVVGRMGKPTASD